MEEQAKASIQEPVWAEVDCASLRHNFLLMRAHVGPAVKIMAVVKANAYGHGAVQVARELADAGTDALAVARLNEAIALREAGLRLPLLLFGWTPPENATLLIRHNIIQSVHSLDYAEELHRHAAAAGGRIQVQVKVDTGMGRLGFLTPGKAESPSLAKIFAGLSACSSLIPVGIYTHFASSDASDLQNAREQLHHFETALADLAASRPQGLQDLCIHAANSAAAMVLPASHFNMVRPGIMLYGLRPSLEMDSSFFALRPVMSIKARLAAVKEVDAGFSVSYGHTHITNKKTVIGTVPIGYADGYPRQFSSRGTVLVRGVRAPVVGRVCMDLLMVDLGHIPGAQAKDEVVLLGKQGAEEISADEHASQTGTINYEVVSRLLPRVPRIFLHGSL